MPSTPLPAIQAAHHRTFPTNPRLSTPNATTTTVPGPVPLPPTPGPSAPPPLPTTTPPLSPLDPPPALLPYFTLNALKPDIPYPYPYPYPHPPSAGIPARPLPPSLQWQWQREWEAMHGTGGVAPVIGAALVSPLPTFSRTRIDTPRIDTPSSGQQTPPSSWQQRWESIYGPGSTAPLRFWPLGTGEEGPRASAVWTRPGVVAGVEPLCAEVGCGSGESEEKRGRGRKRANAVSAGSGLVARTEVDRPAVEDGVPEPAPHAARRADALVRRPRNPERVARMQRQRREGLRERVRRWVGGRRIPGYDYGGGAEETARARWEGVWVGHDGGEGEGEEKVGLRGGVWRRWVGGGGGCEGPLAEDEEAEEEEDEVEWSEEDEDDDYFSSFNTAFPEGKTPPASGDNSDADAQSDGDDEEEPSPFTDEMIWDEELGRHIILVSSSFTTRNEGALVEVTEIHLDGEDVEEGVKKGDKK